MSKRQATVKVPGGFDDFDWLGMGYGFVPHTGPHKGKVLPIRNVEGVSYEEWMRAAFHFAGGRTVTMGEGTETSEEWARGVDPTEWAAALSKGMVPGEVRPSGRRCSNCGDDGRGPACPWCRTWRRS